MESTDRKVRATNHCSSKKRKNAQVANFKIFRLKGCLALFKVLEFNSQDLCTMTWLIEKQISVIQSQLKLDNAKLKEKPHDN